MLLLYRKLPALLVGNHPYYKIGKLKIALIIVNKYKRLYRNYVENPKLGPLELGYPPNSDGFPI